MIVLASLAIALPFCAAFAGMLLGPRLSRLLGARPLPAAESEPGTGTPDAPTTPLPVVRPETGPVPGGGPRAAEMGRLVTADFALRGLPRNGPALIAVVPTAVATVLALVVAFTLWRDPGVRGGTLTLVPTGSVDIAIGLQVDGLAALIGLMVCLVALAVQVYSVAYMAKDPRYSSYAAFVSLFTAAMLLVVYAGDLLLLYVGWEVMGVCSYFLIGHHWEERANSRAAVKAFLVTRLGDVGFLLGIFVLGIGAGTFSIGGVLDAVPQLPAGTLTAATLLLLAGVAGKSAQFPLHTWLPDAMAGPTPISALIHAATMVAAGIYVIARLYPAFLAAPGTLTVLGIVAVISMLGSALAALAQNDLKRVLAYSTISQLAYMAAGLAVGAQTAAIFHLVAHGAFKALLFLAAGSVIFVAGSNLLGHYGGLRRAMPVTFWSMTVGYAALVGLPPVSGFFSKDAIIEGARHTAALAGHREPGAGEQGHAALSAAVPDIPAGAAWLIYIGLLVTVGVTAAYATRAWLMTFFGEQRTSFEAREAPALMTWTVAALAVPAALLGFFGLGAAELRPHLVSAGVSLLWAAGGIAVAHLLWNRDPALDPADRLGPVRKVFDRAFYVDEVYAALVVRPVRAVARAVVATDRHGIDALVVGTAGWSRRAGGALRRVQTGNAQAYLTGLLAGVIVIAAGVVILL
ncbi:NADH-quinone oxidoreductase subunit 5 family protein [Thermomonospora cellulosilytica]|uniref:NADH-quinone oxidoreductase subunit L n=1 Tax=Thermomonospora cellulosilytica TaxID=1411118 RepID=A0A7W3MT54_9ACTN|nr:NADH-quinone oxidoreductase subunit L [Thermomonospora cellulosilytica]MBA9001368.1 NADH-quinone oxidoreductase subunit L [Thermomonospora cellulosilytica]